MSKISVYDFDGKATEKIDFEVGTLKEVSPRTYSCNIRVLLQNWRQGTVSCKGRGDVAFSNRKPWKQKGTGRARAGSLRSPIWRKGGVIFGPQPRTRRLSINKKQVKLALDSLKSHFMGAPDDKVYCVDYDFQKSVGKPNTKKAFSLLKNLGLNNKKVVLFLSFDDEISFASVRNIPNVNVISFDQPNAYDLSNGDCWFFFKKDIGLFKEMVSKWN